MKKLYLLFFCICSVATLAAQLPVLTTNHLGEEYVSLNFILVRNNGVLRTNVSITAIDSIGKQVILKNVIYEPGNLLIEKSEYDALQEMSGYKLCYSGCDADTSYYSSDYYSYEIPFTKEQFRSECVIIEVDDFAIIKKRRKYVFRPYPKTLQYSYVILNGGYVIVGFVKADTTLE